MEAAATHKITFAPFLYSPPSYPLSPPPTHSSFVTFSSCIRFRLTMSSKPWINVVSHSIKKYLSKHISTPNLKLIAFFIALFSCLSSGSILLFSLFSVSIHETIGMTFLQINLIASLSAIGMYLCLPILGYLSDCYGPSLLSLIAFWLFIPSYFFAARIIKSAVKTSVNSTLAAAAAAASASASASVSAGNSNTPPPQLNPPLPIPSSSSYYLYSLGACFFFVGLATSSLYFSSLLTCAKIYPKYKGLAISLPVSCYGMSSLILSQLMKLDYFHKKEDDDVHVGASVGEKSLDLVKVFSFFVYLYFVIGILNFVACSIVSIESEVIFSESNQTTPLLQDEETGSTNVSSRGSTYSSTSEVSASRGQSSIPSQSQGQSSTTTTQHQGKTAQREIDDDSVTAEDSFLPQRELVEPPNHHERYIAFLQDPSAWLLLVSLILNLGPMESFQNNLGSIITNLSLGEGETVNLSNQVSVMATTSTISRLLFGVLSDYLSSDSRKYPVCKVWLLMFVIFIGIVGQLLPISSDYSNPFSVVSGINGFSYGGLFTIYPTIIASVWGIDIMGSTWGSFMVAPAIGSIGYSILYGLQVDSKCKSDSYDQGLVSCLSAYFSFTSGGLLISLVLVVIVWRAFWVKRGFIIF